MIVNLVRRAKQTKNEAVQQNANSTRHAFARLAFADYMNRFIAGDRTPRGPE